MLSYQHIYHAGNLADVQKHALLAWVLSYLSRKDKPLSYIETHAGRGLYQLDANEALKTGEAQAGIARVLNVGALQGHPLTQVVSDLRAQYGAMAYPGSPVLAASLLRPGDTMHLAELHPQEYAALKQTMRPYRAKVYRQDGYEMVQSICPPTPRRGMVLIDPSYEIENDYTDMSSRIARLHRKWNVGVIALWYPILTSGAHAPMLKALEAQNLPGAFRHEVRFPPVREGHRMVGSGMFFANAPFGLQDAATEIDKMFVQIR